MRIRVFCIGLLLAFMHASLYRGQAGDVPSVAGSRMEELATKGFDLLYNLDYDQAADVFQRIISEYPDDPAGYFYLSSNIWLKFLNDKQELEIGNFTSAVYFSRKAERPLDQDTRNAFERAVNLAVTKAESLLAKDPKNVRAIYYLGAAYGNIAGFHATAERSFWTAFRSGTKAHDCHKKVLGLDPTFFDAYLVVGLYDYIAGSIPWSARWLATLIGYSGDKLAGLEKLKLAADKARYNRKDARVMTAVVLAREKRYGEALAYMTQLQREYPRNPLLHADLAGLLTLAGKYADAAAAYQQILARIREGRAHYSQLKLQQVYLRLGSALLSNGQVNEAREAFARVLAESESGAVEITVAQLRMGQVADLQDDRDKALACYQKVLAMPDYQDAQEQARKYMKKPFRL